MSSKKLKNAPLREAIFELFWDSPVDNTGMRIDQEFELSLGKFQLNVEPQFPIHRKILPPAPLIRVYGVPIHQFWRGEVQWPVIQFGPGILSLHETDKNYHWEETYRPNIQFAISSLKKSYNVLPTFNKVSLKYVDSVDVKNFDNLQEYIDKNLLTQLVNKFSAPGKLSGLNINQIFDIDDSKVSLNIFTAVNNVTSSFAVVWITSVIRIGKISENDLLLWIDKAHTITSDLFIEMLNPDFYASFDK